MLAQPCGAGCTLCKCPRRAPPLFCHRVSPRAHGARCFSRMSPVAVLASGHNSTTRRCWHRLLHTSVKTTPGASCSRVALRPSPRRSSPSIQCQHQFQQRQPATCRSAGASGCRARHQIGDRQRPQDHRPGPQDHQPGHAAGRRRGRGRRRRQRGHHRREGQGDGHRGRRAGDRARQDLRRHSRRDGHPAVVLARSRATSITCRWPSSRAPSSTAAAAVRPMPASSTSTSRPRHGQPRPN